VLGTGDLRRKLTIHAHRFSAEAKRKIEAAGGTAAVIAVPPPIREKTKRAKNQPKPAPASEKAETPETAVAPEAALAPEAAEAADTAAAPAKASKKTKAEPSEKAGKGQPARASASEDSPKPDKGKKKA
jgi:hypothetical protein